MVGVPYRWKCESGFGETHEATRKLDPPVAHPRWPEEKQISFVCLPCASTLGLLPIEGTRVNDRTRP